jgi:hypothetical protein
MAKTGIMNSSQDVKGAKMGNTPASDKVGLLPAREPVKGGLGKKKMVDRERPSPGGKKLSDKVVGHAFDPASRGK